MKPVATGMDNISVCHILNTIRGTSMVSDLARTQVIDDGIGRVGMLAWFDIKSRDNVKTVALESLDVPNTIWINREQYTNAKSILSEYDIVHTHRPHSGVYAKLIAKRLGKSVIQTEHNNHVAYTTKGQIANGVTNVLADAVVCVSESVCESFGYWEKKLVKDEKTSVIPNGVDIERLEAAENLEWSIHDVVDIDPRATIVGSAGMLTEQKAHDVLIEAVDQANTESEQPIELVISGDGKLREQLEAQIADAKYSDRLHLLGFLEARDQVHKMMHETDIYAMPSRWEGFCVAALEAMAIGNACVFADIPEFRRPFDGLARFHSLDETTDLAQEINHLVEDSNERQSLSERGTELVANKYTIERTAEQYMECYRSVSQR